MFIPAYLAFIGAQRDPFVLTSEDIIGPMQELWDRIYPDTEHDIQPRAAVYNLVSLQLCYLLNICVVQISLSGSATQL
jgi:hypothetical protein